MTTLHATAESVDEQIRLILSSWGMASDMIEEAAKVMVETDLMGVDSHGISMLMTYEGKMQEGRLDLKAAPKVESETAATAVVDAGANLGHPVSVMAMNLAVDKAEAVGVGVVTVRNSHHFGAAGYYAKIAADRGAIGMVASTARGITVVPTGGAAPVLGTNPLAYAAPTRRHRPWVLDMATSTVAVGKVRVYGYQDKPLPDGWVSDGEGRPVKDGTEAYNMLVGSDVGGLTPIGGTRELSSHKGYGLGVLAQILGGALAGGAFVPVDKAKEKPDSPENIGHCFMAIAPATFQPAGAFEDHVDTVIDTLHATPAADPAQPVLVAGDPEAAKRAERLEKGIPIPQALDAQLREVCDRAGVAYVLSAKS
ncbi:MAG: Ldh family oxidoreductase [Pseudomonadota bacterium]